MNIAVKDHQGNVVLRVQQFICSEDCAIDANEIIDCLFIEDEFWIRDELCAWVQNQLQATPNHQADVNDQRDELEISQDNKPSYFVFIEDNNKNKVTAQAMRAWDE